MSPRKRVKVDTSETEDASQACARRDEITEKLKALGYGDEDLDPRFDEDDWKWNTLLDNDSLSTEHSWEKILPQLEATIDLRREHKASEFRIWRRSLRETEVKARFSQYRPRLEYLVLHKLFLDADLFELPAVRELIEENECRVPLTEERWLTVQNILVQSVSDHASRIEEDCHDAVVQAKYGAKDLANERWSDERRKKWVQREEEIDREEEENGVDREDPEYERSWNPKYLDEPTDDLVELEEDYEFDIRGLVGGQDAVPLCFSSAQSLLEQEVDGIRIITSYTDILRRRATAPLYHGPAWRNEDLCSDRIVDIAVLLLRHLGVSPRARMAYMVACGSVFRCRRCSQVPVSEGVTWAELVQHFVAEHRRYNELLMNASEEDINNLDENGHNLIEEEYRPLNLGVPVSMPEGLEEVAGGPFTNAGHLYTQLAATW
ncbi:hypothetical protein SCHPADRAFT_119875 [Schizopora paradoxa]|uniref:Uncharacterized protein n=1 Tax=Schizopora paradoxa TaxID=27342 RepID=A0A0H2SN46_9AGAM|nr:hypothetical protein SCHPADRAFT_119875 [Schizopora paradoxa]